MHRIGVCAAARPAACLASWASLLRPVASRALFQRPSPPWRIAACAASRIGPRSEGGTPTRLIGACRLASIRRQNISLNDRRGGGVGGGGVRLRPIRSSGVSGPKGTTALAASAGVGRRPGRAGAGGGGCTGDSSGASGVGAAAIVARHSSTRRWLARASGVRSLAAGLDSPRCCGTMLLCRLRPGRNRSIASSSTGCASRARRGPSSMLEGSGPIGSVSLTRRIVRRG
jgi:hypothetical protein